MGYVSKQVFPDIYFAAFSELGIRAQQMQCDRHVHERAWEGVPAYHRNAIAKACEFDEERAPHES